MNLRLLVGAVLFATDIAAWLSMNSIVGLFGKACSSDSIRRSHCVYCTASAAAMYSDSHVDNACIVCLVDIHEIGDPLIRCMAPLVDLESNLSPA